MLFITKISQQACLGKKIGSGAGFNIINILLNETLQTLGLLNTKRDWKMQYKLYGLAGSSLQAYFYPFPFLLDHEKNSFGWLR